MLNTAESLDSRVEALEEKMDKHLEVLNEISAKLDKLDGIHGELVGLRGDLNGGFKRLWEVTGEYKRQTDGLAVDLNDETAETYRREIAVKNA